MGPASASRSGRWTAMRRKPLLVAALAGDEHPAADPPGDAAVVGRRRRTRGGRTSSSGRRRVRSTTERDSGRVDHPDQAQRHAADPAPVGARQPFQMLRAPEVVEERPRSIVTSASCTEATAPVSGTRSDSREPTMRTEAAAPFLRNATPCRPTTARVGRRQRIALRRGVGRDRRRLVVALGAFVWLTYNRMVAKRQRPRTAGRRSTSRCAAATT